MRFAAAIATVLLAAAPVSAQVVVVDGEEMRLTKEDLPEGYPPKMGDVTGTLDGKPVAWETYDFSVGAFDASAGATSDWETKVISVRIIGYTPGDPDSDKMLLRLQGDFGTVLRPGPASGNVEIAILREKDWDGAQLTSAGKRAELVIDSIGPKVPDSYSRHVTGHASAQLCPKKWLFKSCKDIELRFDTDMQVGSELPIEMK
ncbi:hypothetical protein L0V05_12825 [Tabrizicola sp. J26]|uniref:hypothetical protein n=1 Tax=Alitabrizicola rongguiensis TaxID=2909234 RepID=UPI001F39892B|nr:hypothetical protein [Tabrizicola rongguiensis]MCF1709697.1 hypothetical protein [Tabrizicola rongguiensis]